MRLGIEKRQGHLPDGSLKIGFVAGHFGVSVDLLRLYEREGLLIPIKSARGTRYFTDRDFPWIAMILRLVRESHVNLAAIRRQLAALPCWRIRNCDFESRQGCPVISDQSRPCWSNRAMCPVVCAQDCYYCPVYRSAPDCKDFRVQLPPIERLAPPLEAIAT